MAKRYIADSFEKSGGTGNNVLLDDGTTDRNVHMFTASAVGDGFTSAFAFAHGLDYTPSVATAGAKSFKTNTNALLELLTYYVYCDALYVYIVYEIPISNNGDGTYYAPPPSYIGGNPGTFSDGDGYPHVPCAGQSMNFTISVK